MVKSVIEERSSTEILKVPVLIAVGMHRSGTSCLAGSLHENNVFLGDVHLRNPFNLKGNRENQAVVDLNDAVLAFNNASWDNPPVGSILWDKTHEKTRDDIIRELNHSAIMNSCKYWGFKDPRTLLVLPFWRQAIKDINFVGTFRHPLSVALSLKKRNSATDIDEAIDLWEKYNGLLLDLWRKEKFSLVCFDVAGDVYTKDLQKLFATYGLEAKNTFYSKKLRKNHHDMLEHHLLESTIDLYQELFQIYKKQEWQCSS